MQDFPRLFVAPVVVLSALMSRQNSQSIHCKLRIKHQRLESRDDGIPPERGGEPRYAGRNDVLVAFRNLQRVKIADRSVDCGVENIVAAAEVGGPALPLKISLPSLPQVRHVIAIDGPAPSIR